MRDKIILFVIAYLIIINLLGFAIMGIDKEKAKRKAWRIPEKTFFLVSFLGGSLGSFLGMRVFRHKTRHWYFVIGIPTIFILQVVGSILLFVCFS
ncbi:MAG: DUF1294 domain-containing protein [Agathobacter sp.]|nr:DUF1294 domain-containing protein [Agathobacter sp.]